MIALQRTTPHIGDCRIEGVLQPTVHSKPLITLDGVKKISSLHVLPFFRCRTKKHSSKLCFRCCPKSIQKQSAALICSLSSCHWFQRKAKHLQSSQPKTHDLIIPETFKTHSPYIPRSAFPKCPASLLPTHGFPANAVAPGSKTSASKLELTKPRET